MQNKAPPFDQNKLLPQPTRNAQDFNRVPGEDRKGT